MESRSASEMSVAPRSDTELAVILKTASRSDDAGPDDSGCWIGVCARRLFPQECRREAVEIVKLAGPMVISQMMTVLISFISMVFCGHLGTTELAAVSLAVAVINVTGISIGVGLSLACDTLISQRGVLIVLLACFPCWALLVNTEPILLAVRQTPEVARLSQVYVNVYMPALPATFLYQLQIRYLQNQAIIWPQVISGLFGNAVNALSNYIFLYPLNLGVFGSAAANAIAQYFLVTFLFVYIYWRGLHLTTWAGWSRECLQEWGPYIKLALPSMMMLCLEWWMFELGGFLAGLFGETELGAQTIILQLATISYMTPFGLASAASVRVGNALGAGNAEQAKLSSKVPVAFAVVVGCVVGVTLSSLRSVVAYIFTSDEVIVSRVADVMIMYAVFHLADATAGVIGGILRGAGKQLVGATCNLVGYYIIGFPIGASLMFAADMGIVGLWTGLTVCVTLQGIFFITYVVKLDWQKAAEEAQERAGVQTRAKEGDSPPPPPFNPLEADQQQAQARLNCVSAEVDLSASSTAATATERTALSVKQLVLRRGGTLLIMIAVLALGIVISNLLVGLLK